MQPQNDGSLILPGHLAEVHISPQSVAKTRFRDGNALMGIDVERDAENNNEKHMAANPTDFLHIGVTGLLENWHSTLDEVTWSFRTLQPGVFAVQIHTVAPKYKSWTGGHEVQVSTGEKVICGPIKADEILDLPRTYHFEEAVSHLGTLYLEPGHHVLTLRALHINTEVYGGLRVGQVVLEPT